MTITRKAQTGEPGNKGQFGSKLNTDAEATLERSQPQLIPVTEYDPDAGYLQRLESARDPRQSAEALERIASREAEDDFFMLAVAGHPNATPEAIDQATRHQFLLARMAAARNPNTSDCTLDRLIAEASEPEIDALARHRRANTIPKSKQAHWEATQNADIVAAIHQPLAG